MAKATTIEELEKEISVKDVSYVLEYIKNGNNATQAAIHAGYKESTAKAKSAKWISVSEAESAKPKLYLYYHAILQQRKDKFDIEVKEVINELKSIAFSDITKLINIHGYKLTVKSMDDIPDIIKPAIQSISKNSMGGITIKLYNKLDALKTLLEFDNQNKDESGAGVNIENINFNIKASSSNLLDPPKND